MPRFFIAGSNIAGGTAVITGADATHIKVLRLKVGDELVLCDGAGSDYHCRIRRFSEGEVETEVVDRTECRSEPNIRVTILAGLPKGERGDLIVQKCTELGADEVVFFMCERCVARPDDRAIEKRLVRFGRIAAEAAKQSERGSIPKAFFVPDFASALNVAAKKDLRLFMYETGERKPLREAIEDAGSFRTAAIMTGPEGGFEAWEAKLASAAGMTLCSMGPRILRCETAPSAALTALMYATDNM